MAQRGGAEGRDDGVDGVQRGGFAGEHGCRGGVGGGFGEEVVRCIVGGGGLG